jgi:hypothetical protein
MSSLTVTSFVNQANQAIADGDRSLRLDRGGSLAGMGRMGEAFTSKETNRATMQAFIASLREEYGDAIANLASNRLRGPMAEGKALSAHMIKEMASEAQTRKMQFSKAAFISGVDVNGARLGSEAPTLNKAIEGFVRSRHLQLSSGERAALKDFLAQSILKHEKPIDNKDLFNSIANGNWGAPGSAINQVLGDKLSTIDQLLQGRNLMNAAPGSLEDKIRLCTLLDTTTVEAVALDKLSAMRALQPNGALSEATLWRSTFDEPMPAGVSGKNFAQAFKAKYDEQERQHADELPPRDKARRQRTGGIDAFRRATRLVPASEVIKAGHGHNIDGVSCLSPSSFDRANLWTEYLDESLPPDKREAASAKIAMYRFFGESGNMLPNVVYKGAPTTIEFALPGSQTKTITLDGTNMPSAAPGTIRSIAAGENTNKTDGTPDTERCDKARGLIADMENNLQQLALPPRQEALMFSCMQQNGQFQLEALEAAAGRPFDPEHQAFSIQVRKEDNGDMVVRHAIYDAHDGQRAAEPRSWLEMRVTREGVLVPNQPLHIQAYRPQ